MRLREFAVDLLMRTHLFEMAFSRGKAIERTTDLQFQIAIHMIKCIMYRESMWTVHWQAEINSWLHTVQRLKIKGTGKPLDSNTLYNILYTEPLGEVIQVQHEMNLLYREYPKLRIDQPNPEIVQDKLKSMLLEVCKDISVNKFDTIENYM